MKCPFCSYADSRVIDSRSVDNGTSIRRRRECLNVGAVSRLTKIRGNAAPGHQKDGRRELFDSQKLTNGLLKAFEKRPFSYEQIQSIASGIERDLRALGESEVKSTLIGETVMKALEKIDQIAYVRFASVYRQFADVNSFMQEIQGMLSKMDDKNNY